MASWDFCDDCNSGRHCCSHDDCGCRPITKSIESYTVKELQDYIRKLRASEKKQRDEERLKLKKEKLQQLKKLRTELKKLK